MSLSEDDHESFSECSERHQGAIRQLSPRYSHQPDAQARNEPRLTVAWESAEMGSLGRRSPSLARRARALSRLGRRIESSGGRGWSGAKPRRMKSTTNCRKKLLCTCDVAETRPGASRWANAIRVGARPGHTTQGSARSIQPRRGLCSADQGWPTVVGQPWESQPSISNPVWVRQSVSPRRCVQVKKSILIRQAALMTRCPAATMQ